MPVSYQEYMLKVMGQALLIVTNKQRELADVKTGAMRHSIGFEQPHVEGNSIVGTTFAGGAGAPYAKPHEFGTGVFSEAPDSSHKPIIIVPKNKKALAWPRMGVGPSVRFPNSFAQAQHMHLGSPGGPNLRLSGELRSHVLKALAQGKITHSSVFSYAMRVVQQGQKPRSFMRRGAEESLAAISELFAKAVDKFLADTFDSH